ncbi:cobalamin biosynthesis protein [Calothrix sp. UHCC 0171]|uniref:cobalamin biosynthesis protein n=1 Tax=Calothrix sp. UHCC 0171 TaxID=3110245 RepID=UPI002B20AF18|nr:cobalamin biosynthesis protein [Calothrix sp. UHCC 0171]MEA5570187.1 cobalamin biosynthesis protein [Calothrix sp. UHCC 0171]
MDYIYKLWVGIGCTRGTSQELIEFAIAQIFREHGLLESAIVGIATVDSKVSEIGLIQFCQTHNLLLKLFSSQLLQNIIVPNPSQFVAAQMETFSVAEAAAILASYDSFHVQLHQEIENAGKNIFPANQENYFDHSLNYRSNLEKSMNYLLIPKQKFSSVNSKLQGNVTVAVAIAKQ